MSQHLAISAPVAPVARSAAAVALAAPPAAHEHAPARDPRRRLQLALAAMWLLDALLQFQPFMFGRGFGQMLAGSAHRNPAIVARPVTWSAAFIDHHTVVLNALFATAQLLLGLGIAWRPAVKPALAASVVWALAVWWLGEGLGGLLTGTASPVNGAPGAALLYALLAVLLWPADRTPASPAVRAPASPAVRAPASPAVRTPASPAARAPVAPFPAARAVGQRAARAIWLVVWLGLVGLALLPATQGPGVLSDMIASTTPGEPAWLAWLDTHAASVLARHGLLASILLATVLAAVALGACLPRPASRAAIVLAIAVALALALAQGLGGILSGSATDPDTAPLLALFALAFWPPAAQPARLPSAPQPVRGSA